LDEKDRNCANSLHICACARNAELGVRRSLYSIDGLVAASAGFGTVYAWKTGSAHGYLLGGLSVMFAVALEVAKPLAVQGFFSAARAWAFGQALCLAVLAVFAVAYSLTAELSLMAGIRSDVVAARQAQSRTAKDHAKAAEHREVERQRIERELATVGKARPAAELKALIAAYRSKGVCAIPDMASVCPANKLNPELGRAERREKLELALAELNQVEQFVSAAPIEVKADPAAEALSIYLGLLGITVHPATLTEIMILVPVLALEIGSALAVVLARSVVAGDLAKASEKGASGAAATAQENTTRHQGENPNQHHSPKPRRSARNGLLEMLASAKGPLRIGQEGLAEALGVTSARVRQLLKELAAAGTIRVRTSSTGSLITLVAGGRA
jgi:hypothetical protein